MQIVICLQPGLFLYIFIMKDTKLETITAWAKRRGFVYPSSEIYGGLANTYDFGPYGIELKNNLRDSWWKNFVTQREDVVGIDASTIINPKVWEASGHTKAFADAMVECKNCHTRTRADHLIEDKVDTKVEGLSLEKLEEIINENKLKCPTCGKFDWTKPRHFNQLFETSIGIIKGEKNTAYLRGEIAQGIFINYKNVLDSMRVRIPFGIAQAGKAFRNEITMGQFTFRTLEFDLMEFEFFIRETEWEKWYGYWKEQIYDWYKSIGIMPDQLRWREHTPEERAHYSSMTEDLEYQFPFGWKEMAACAYRGNFDLTNHQQHSGANLEYIDPVSKERFIPHVIEPTFGLSRLMTVLFFDCYTEEKLENGNTRTVFKINPKLAPVKAAIFPLQKDEKLRGLARDIFTELKQNYNCEFDDSGNIGKMYRRQDEIGTPFCITVDYDSVEKKSVTVRDRDTMQQERIEVAKLAEYLKEKLQ